MVANDPQLAAEPSSAQAPAEHATPRRYGSGVLIVAFAFLIVMAFATLPSPLYGLYKIRDHLSQLTITVVYAILAAGTSLRSSPRTALRPAWVAAA
jgi:hypothetical protein